MSTTTIADPVQAILDRLDNVKQTGPKQWIARCPAHEDRTPSLSISRGNDGRAILHCHGGCDTKDILAAIGIELRDLFPPTVNNKPKAKTKGRIVKTYDYNDAEGRLLFQVVRFDPKDFRQRRPDGNDGWIHNLNGTPRVLYRLPELIAANGDGWIFVVEGEKDADALAALGLGATCNSGGAGKWSKVDDSPLHGRRVAIIPDADTPGRKHTRQIAAALHGKAADVRIVELPGKGKDVTDFIEAIDCPAEDTRGDLLALADAAPVYEPPPKPKPATDKPDTPPDPGGAVMVCMADVKPQPLHWLWPGRFPLGKTSLIAGNPGLGKSLMTLDIAARVSRGLPWPDAPGTPTEPGSIVLLSAEDDIADTIRPRLDAAGADVKRIVAIQGVMYSDDDTAGILRERGFSLQYDLPALQDAITQTDNVRMVIIDPITAYLGGTNSHKNAEVRGLLAPLAQLAAKHKVAIIAVTHLNKNAAGSAMYRAMGSLAFAAAARAYWAIIEDKENPDRRLFLPVKCNLSAGGDGLAYGVLPFHDNPDIPVIAWEADPVSIGADEAMAAGAERSESHSALEEASDWLRGVLSAGPMKAKEIKKQANADGIASRTLDRAKASLGIKAKRDGYGGPWVWTLPT